MQPKILEKISNLAKQFDHWVLLHTALIAACLVGVAIFAFSYRGASADWYKVPNGTTSWVNPSYTNYSTVGVHPITVTQPGTNLHYAQYAATQNIGTLRYDPIAPNFLSQKMTFAANITKGITLSFDDLYAGEVLSGVALINVQVKKPDGTYAAYSASSATAGLNVNITFTHNFSKVGKYDLIYSASDHATNSTTWTTIPDFFTVVASTPEWSAAQCAGTNYETTCPSTITIPTASGKIADGAEYYTATVKLADRYGNRVVSVTNVKNVSAEFEVNNTSALDQIAGVGDSIRLRLPDTGLDLIGADNGTAKITTTGFVSSDNGEYTLRVSSYAPTKDGYLPITDTNFRIGLKQINYRITTLSGLSGVGEVSASQSSDRYFAFLPALTALPQAMNFTNGAYNPSTEAAKNITINASKRFLLSLAALSNSKNISEIELGLLIQSGDSDVTWGAAALERSNGIDVTNALNLITAAPMTSVWNTIPSAANAVDVGATEYIRMQSTPILSLGTGTTANFSTLFVTHIGYDVNGRHPRHRSEKLTLGNGTDSFQVTNTNIQVIGAAHTDAQIGFISTLDGQRADSTLGDVFRSEFRTAISRNIAPYVSNPAVSSNACKNARTITSNIGLDSLPCKFSGGTVFYFEGADVTFDGATLLPSGKKTLIVRGGNLYIKNNLSYQSANDSLGIILLKNDNKSGNLFIYPNVTNLSLALYAEGSVVSVNHLGKYTEYTGNNCNSSDGFCDRSYELRNQLYWQGSLVSQNTIGGSDHSSPACPAQFTSACDRSSARIFDLNYLRTFHATAGGVRATGVPLLTGETQNNHAFIIKYDSRIKTNTPPLFADSSSTGGAQKNY